MALNKHRAAVILLLVAVISTAGCFRYSFTGTSIPENVNTVYIPFFPDQSNSGLGDLSNRLNDALVNRFISKSRLQLANDRQSADAILEGVITQYNNKPFTVAGNNETSENRVQISVTASFKYKSDKQALWDKSFSGYANYDPNDNPIEGENNAAADAMDMIANNMFNDAVGSW